MRYLQLDFFRGLMLIIMVINHLGGTMTKMSKAPLGLFSVALGFIFLSGSVIGILSVKKENKNHDVWSKSFYRRASKLYTHHALSFFLLFILGFIFYSFGIQYSIFEKFNFGNPLPLNLFLGFSLLLKPKFLDILPIYIFFLLLIPMVLKWLKRGKVLIVFLISGFVYAISQILNLHYFQNLISESSMLELGGFDLFSWQFLFFLGVILGYLYEKQKLHFLVSKEVLLFSFLVVLGTTVLRRATFFDAIFDYEVVKVFADFVVLNLSEKGKLAIVPLMNFLVVALFIFNLVHLKIISFRNKWVELLGQHSLDVFTLHVFLVFVGIIIKETMVELLPGTVYLGLDVLISIAGVSALFLFVYLKSQKQLAKPVLSSSLKADIGKIR